VREQGGKLAGHGARQTESMEPVMYPVEEPVEEGANHWQLWGAWWRDMERLFGGTALFAKAECDARDRPRLHGDTVADAGPAAFGKKNLNVRRIS
jgi:hypothetical protein